MIHNSLKLPLSLSLSLSSKASLDLSLSNSPFLFSSLIGSGGGVIPWSGDERVATDRVVVVELDLSLRWKELIGLEVEGRERS